MSQRCRMGGCSGDGAQGLPCRSGQDGVGKPREPRVCPERSSHMLCVRAVGLIQELSAPPREVSDAFIYEPTGSCAAPASHMQEKAGRSQDKQSQQHPRGRQRRAGQGCFGCCSARRWWPEVAVPRHHSPEAGLQRHRLPRHPHSCPWCAGCAGTLWSRWGMPVGSQMLPPVQGMLLVPKGREGCEFPQE